MLRRFLLFSFILLLTVSAVPLALADSDCDFSYSNYARAVQLHDMGDYARAIHHYNCALEENPDDAIIPILIENVQEDIADAPSAWSRDADAEDDNLLKYLLSEAEQMPLDVESGDRMTPTSPYIDVAQADESLSSLRTAEYLLVVTTNRWEHRVAALQQVDMIYRGEQDELRRRVSQQAFQYQSRQENTAIYLFRKVEDLDSTWIRAGATVYYELTYAARISSTVEIMRASISIIDLPVRPRIVMLDSADTATNDRGTVDRAPVSAGRVTPARVSPAQRTFAQGLYYLAAGKLYMAATTFIEALELDPRHDEARCRLGAVYAEWANYGTALAHFDKILERDPNDTCARQNRKKAVSDMLAMYLPLTVDDFFHHARTYTRLEEWELARDAFRKGLAIDPTRVDVRCELGMVYAELGDDQAALREFDHALLRDDMDSCAWSNRDALLQRLRDQ